MSPARAKTSRSAKKAKKAARPARPAKGARGKPKAAKARKPAPASARQDGKRHCAATDPFGDPCQSAPRLPSKYCTIHSYLDR